MTNTPFSQLHKYEDLLLLLCQVLKNNPHDVIRVIAAWVSTVQIVEAFTTNWRSCYLKGIGLHRAKCIMGNGGSDTYCA